MVEQPVMVRIEKVVSEAKDHTTLVLRHSAEVRPGQFVMLWLPRLGLKPFSVSYKDSRRIGILVNSVGPFTRKLCSLRPGGRIGVQGPYGNGFTVQGRRPCLVAGGCGAASLALLADLLPSYDFLIGARSRDLLLYRRRFRALLCTDDGSHGFHGYVTQLLEQRIRRYDQVYACGPEPMLKSLAALCDRHHMPYQLSLERYMKCGFGVCGSCAMDPTGVRVCTDGPVFDHKKVKLLAEFGAYRRDSAGAKVTL